VELYYFWGGAHAASLVFGVIAFLRRSPPGEAREIGAIIVSLVASIPPLITWLLVLKVFIIGGSSNIVQIAGPAGTSLWSLWARAWLYLLYGNGIALLVTGLAMLFPPYPPERASSVASRALAATAAGVALYFTFGLFPSA